MEALGARLGRSSSRYGPAAVFNGPVRRWKKTWVPLSSSSHSNHPSSNNASHVLLYKWTPLSQNSSGKDDSSYSATSAATEEPPRKKFRYVPVSVLEEQKKEASEQVDDQTKSNDNAVKDQEPVASKDDNIKSDVNDGPAEETQALGKDQTAALQVNETNLDLSLGLKAHGDQSTEKVKAAT